MHHFDLSVQEAVTRIRENDSKIRAFISKRLDRALLEDENQKKEKSLLPLAGVPYSLKDAWEIKGCITTGGSFRHRERVSSSSASVYQAFQSAGAILLGKTNLSDMGMVPDSANYLVGSTRNPHHLTRTAGGSSGGAAAAVASRMSAFDWGTDIGGSIRIPASFCKIFGMKLSSQSWKKDGLFPAVPKALEFLLGQGPLARTLPQIRDLLKIAAPTLQIQNESSFKLKKVLFYLPRKLGHWPLFEQDMNRLLAKLGEKTFERAKLPSTGELGVLYGELWSSHFMDLFESDPTLNLRSGLQAVLSSLVFRGAFGDRRFHPSVAEIFGLMAIGRFTFYRSKEGALRRTHLFREQMEKLWDQGCVIIAPVCVYPPPRLGWPNWNLDFLSCTLPGNLSDATSLAIPFGCFENGLPRSIQLMGPPGSEMELINLGEQILEVGSLSLNPIH